jgi:hypothetical protein
MTSLRRRVQLAHLTTIIGTSIALFARAQTGHADDAPVRLQSTSQSKAATERELWTAYYQSEARRLSIRPAGQAAHDLTLVDRPLLNYENPVRIYDQHGSLFAWTDQGCVQFVGAVWSGIDETLNMRTRSLSLEGHSLSAGELTGVYQDRTLWSTGDSRVRRHIIAEQPAKQPFARLVQMRRLIAGLTVKIHADVGDLRPLTQPLYRYEQPAAPVIDGALFAWVMSTDPEVVILVEALEDHWELVIVRFTNEALTVHRGQELLYDCEHVDVPTLQGPYWLMCGVERIPTTPPQLGSSTQESQP